MHGDVAGGGGRAWTDWGGVGPLLHFAHGNGFPPGTYRRLIEDLLPRAHVVSMAARPLWAGSSPAGVEGWRPLADDLRRALWGRGLERVVGVGHSMGGTVTALAAAADPELFRALVLIDPVVFTGARALVWELVKALGLRRRMRLARMARRRRERFADHQAVREAYQGKGMFGAWDPEVFEDYVQAGFAHSTDDAVRLRYPREWEARIFETSTPFIWNELKALTQPVLVVRGATSDTFLAAAADRVRRELPTAEVVEVEGATHTVPMEKPHEVARLILAFLDRLSL